MSRRAQLELGLPAPAPAATRGAPPSKAEKVATRQAQHGKCATCGGASKNGHALDVVRRGGALVALCRSHRLSWDAPWRCQKGAGRRRRGTKPASSRRVRGPRRVAHQITMGASR